MAAFGKRQSKFTQVRDAVDRLLEGGDLALAQKLLGREFESKPRGNGTTSVWGMTCPWCGKSGDKDSTPTYLSSNKRKLCCAACSESESLAFIFLKDNHLSISEDANECAERLASVAGVPMPADEPQQWADDWTIDMGPEPAKKADPGVTEMDKGKLEWVDRERALFLARAREGKLSHQETLALRFLIDRGISTDTLERSGLFVTVQPKAVMVVMTSVNAEGKTIGYQWFDFKHAHETGKAVYKACKKEFGSCKWPFGVETVGDKGSILMTCGFSDYLAALEMGFDRVLSPYGVTMLSGDASHLSPVIKGRSITILFDRKKQEIEAAWKNAKALIQAGAKSVSVLAWKGGKEGYDLTDFLVACRKLGRSGAEAKEMFQDAVKAEKVACFRGVGQPGQVSAIQALEQLGLVGSESASVVEEEVETEVTIESERVCPEPVEMDFDEWPEFKLDLEEATAGLHPGDKFHSLIMFTQVSDEFEMCNELVPKPCGLKDKCKCVVNKKLDITDGRYVSAFMGNNRMSAAAETINETYFFPCPVTKGWDDKKNADNKDPKKILYKPGLVSESWAVIEARSLVSRGSKVRMAAPRGKLKPGVYEVWGFKGDHCGMTTTGYIISKIKPYRIDTIIGSIDPAVDEVVEGPFFPRVEAMMREGMIETPDMILASAACAWAFSPPVVPLLKHVGMELDNYKQPSLSIYVIGDSGTGKTESIRESTIAAGRPCNPINSVGATRPGLIASGVCGSPGEMPKNICGAMAMDEVTDNRNVREVIQLLVENSLSINMAGRDLQEVVPVRIALLSNPDEKRTKMHNFRTPTSAALDIVKDHLLRRLDFCVASRSIAPDDPIEKEARNRNLVSSEKVDVTKSMMEAVGKRSWVQRPSLIEVEKEAMEFLLDQPRVRAAINERGQQVRNNSIVAGSIEQKVFRIACGVAGMSGSFAADKMTVKMSHVNDAVLLLCECMTTMGSTKEAKITDSNSDVTGACKVLASVCREMMEMHDSTSDAMRLISMTVLDFIRECSAHEPGTEIDPQLNNIPKTNKMIGGSFYEVSRPRNKGWKTLKKMRDNGLIQSAERGTGRYVIKEMFRSAVSLLQVEEPELYGKIFNTEKKDGAMESIIWS